MEHGLRVPVGLVEIKGVFACLAVVGDHPLVVDAGRVALVFYARLHVGKLPHGLSPQPRPLLDGPPVALVAHSLVFFGVVSARNVVFLVVQRVGVLHGAAAAPVFRHTHGRAPRVAAGVVEELGGVCLGVLPACVFVPGNEVGAPQVARLVYAGGKGGKPGGVEPVVEVVELAYHRQRVVVFAEPLAVAHEHLVEYPPEAHRRVVHLLVDHLVQRLAGVVGHVVYVARIVVAAGAAQGYLAPQHNAPLVAQVVDGFALRIVRQPHHRCPALHDELHVGFVLAAAHGAAVALEVFVAVEAVEGVWPSVEHEAALGVDAERAQPGVLRHAVYHLLPAHQLNPDIV